MKLYSKYLLIFLAALVTGFIFHLALFYFNLGIPNAQEKYLNEWFKKKDAYASSITGQKIMFISGSNTLFGVDAEKIGKEFDIPTINYGTHGGLSYYTLHQAKYHLHSGDIVILPLEYAFYTYHNDSFKGEYCLYVLGYDKLYFTNLKFCQKIFLISQINTLDLLKYTIRQYFPKPQKEHPYDGKYLNTNGDMTHYSSKQQKPPQQLDKLIPSTVFKETPLTTDTIAELTDFIEYCKSNNITIYAAWPNYLWRNKYFTGSDLEGIHAIEDFYREHDVDILGNYTDCLYDTNLFYDTTYHLNAEGKRIHTEYLIRLLRDKIHK